MKRLLSLALLLLALAGLHAQETYNPVANPDAVVTSGKARFTVLTPEMVRIQYSNSSTFEDRATFAVVNRQLPVPSFTTREEDGYLYITTSALELRYKLNSRINASLKSPTNLQITLHVNGVPEVWYPGKEDALNLRGTMRTLDNTAGDTRRGELENGVISRSGWAIIDESPSTVRGDGSKTYAFAPQSDYFDWVAPLADTNINTVDWYFMGYGHNYKRALGDFVKVAGRIPLPPKHMFGYWYSRYWAYTSAEFMQIVREVEKNDIPMDIMILDMDWHKSGWTGWTWNTSLIPNPKSLLSYMHNHNLKCALNLHPADGVASHEDHYAEMKSDLGYDASSNETILWMVERKDFCQSLFNRIIREREAEGVDFWWLDWQQQRTVGGHRSERGYSIDDGLDGLSETFWCNHVFYNDMVENRPDRRPVIYHRWGGMGSHRYPIGFSGDTFATWPTLQWQPYFTSTASNVGWGYWGHDLGGHQADPDNNPERYLRWMQFGVFTPIFRTHATNDGRIERRIWKFPNFPQLRETVVLRYALFPYIYTAARQAYDTGICINRPLYYDYPEQGNAYRFEDEYMFGDNILVAPITTEAGDDQLSRRTTWLPEGKWWDVAKNRLVNGNVSFREKYTLDEIPYFFKAGSVIVNYPYQRTVQTTPETIILKIAPGGSGQGLFYEDGGDNADYADNYATTLYQHTGSATQATLLIGGREGSFAGMPATRTYQVEFLGALGAPTSVSVDGAVFDGADYDAEQHVITLTIPMDNPAQAKTIAVSAPFAEAQTLQNTHQQTEATPESQPRYWITGTAVPGGVKPLENFPGGKFKYHGELLPGELYIIDTDGEQTTTHYLTPSRLYTNIVNAGMQYASKTTKSGGAWTVTTHADNYRFTLDTASKTVSGELYDWLLELYIGGGCVADGQEDKWHTELFQPMENSRTDKNIWTYVGLLKNRPGNVESRRFKLMAQKDWGPVVYHPFAQDEDPLTSTQLRIGGDDTKWAVSRDGYYRITIDSFRETISAEYLGTTLPDGIEATAAASEIEAIYSPDGLRLNQMQKGVNIVRYKNGKTSKILKQ